MEIQEIFDKVARHLLTQKEKALDPVGGECRYRTDDGKRCAVGCLIPDDLYNPDFEGLGCTEPPMIRLLHSIGLISEDVHPVDLRDEDSRKCDLLERLQTAHDCYNPYQWKRRLLEIAPEFRLSTEVLNEFDD